MRILVLDDDMTRINLFKERFRELDIFPGTAIDYAFEANFCIELLEKNEYDIIFLDHDLGGQQFVSCNNKNTGSEVARWFDNNQSNVNHNKAVVVHSFNPSGADYMIDLIPESVYIPGVWIKSEFERVKWFFEKPEE